MSRRVTRSQQAKVFAESRSENASVENSSLKHRKITTKKSGQFRRALGDISNRGNRGNHAKEISKEIKPVNQTSKPKVPAELSPKKEESQLEDIVDLTLAECDVEDQKDPQAFGTYINDIMAYFRKAETRRHPSPTYMKKHKAINSQMREILIDWLVEVHKRFKLKPETMWLTLHVIDRFLERRAVSRTKLQLVGCTGMLIAAKYEEIWAPAVDDFVYISDKGYTRGSILAMESIMLNTLKFNLTVPSAYRFGQRFLRVAKATEEQTRLTYYLMELTLPKYTALEYLPSQIAASGLYLALHLTKAPWTPVLECHTKYAAVDLEKSVTWLFSVLLDTKCKYQAVRKKYSASKYGKVAAKFLGDADNPPFGV